LMNPETGFIKISKFDTKTEEDFTKALASLQKMGMKNLILDLRGNGGGYLNAATSLADQFLANKELIVYTQGLHEPRTDYKATEQGLFEKGPLAILIDEGTASASEIVAGAVQDLDRGFIIGRPSFGKGLVQEQFSFEDGSAMNLTVARYYTPSGRSIQKSYSKGLKEYESQNSVDTTAKKTPIHAFKTAKGRIVYDGSGIMPDYLIPVDTSYYTAFYKKIKEKNLIAEYIYRFLANDKMSDLYKTAADFSKNYTIKNDTFDKFVDFVNTKGLSVSEREIKISSLKIKEEMKAIMARFYFREEGFFRTVNTKDPMIAKALELLNPASNTTL
ncbi:carboxyl-terminal protease, partial [Pseudoxanthomonas sp. SGD-10]